jgi:hypothetical protein
MRRLLIGCCIMMFASAATAEPPTQPVVTSQAASDPAKARAQDSGDNAQPGPAKRICRNLQAGFSHRSERVCMTAKQWEEYDRDGA